MISLKTKMIAAILMAACTFTGPASAQVNMQEANTAIAEFNMQDLSTDLQDKESQGYVFMAQNALDSNNALKDELRIQHFQIPFPLKHLQYFPPFGKSLLKGANSIKRTLHTVLLF